ncbi:MAG: hypothetical protein ABI851_04260 [Saprospiraceae bacterium]
MQLKRFIILFILIVLGHYSFAANSLQVAQNILDRLYSIHGNSLSRKPRIELIDKKSNVAIYSKSKNVIQLERSAYKLCANFGKDSLDALAFILAHELIHAVQSAPNSLKTSFISFDASPLSSVEFERNADVQGLFICYLAGFNSINILPELIDRMYEKYGLSNKSIRGYPTRIERKNSSQLAINQVNKLIELFGLSNRLSQMSFFQQSIQCLEYILKYYQGREIFNNLGINYALHGMNLTVLQGETYVYPLELDWNLRIKKPKNSRGNEPISPLLFLEQQKLFLKAREYFLATDKQDPQYAATNINLFAIEILLDNLETAQTFYLKNLRNTKSLGQDDVNSQRIQMLYAILTAKLNQNEEAIKIWTNLSLSRDPTISYQSQYNLKVINKSRNLALQSSQNNFDHTMFNWANIADANLKLNSIDAEEWISLDSTNSILRKELPNSIFYSFQKKEFPVIHFQEIKLTDKLQFKARSNYINYLGNNQKIIFSIEDHAAFILNENDLVRTLVRFQDFRYLDPDEN